ncbi:hypothetical protein N7530_005903 [Penicillium desertorum]|uniref:Uncharacterized protein n=1 Tax=Penicillium desertorum TaxID=1303715 RepID=A0A9X0BRT6_9EURO|nr:hypothetical protein N7530_005903 [Penicillium desertorum]
MHIIHLAAGDLLLESPISPAPQAQYTRWISSANWCHGQTSNVLPTEDSHAETVTNLVGSDVTNATQTVNNPFGTGMTNSA